MSKLTTRNTKAKFMLGTCKLLENGKNVATLLWNSVRMRLTLPKWDLGVHRDSWNFRVRWQGSKHLTLRRYLYHWKAIKVQMSKMGSYDPFVHLQYNYGKKIKLVVWLPTIKSRESTRSHWVRHTLESSEWKLQLCYRPRPNQRYERRIIAPQSGGSPNRDSFGTPHWESQDKKPLRCRCHGEV